MSIFFAFSDENGDYKKEKTKNFLRAHPYYCRCTLIINGLDWKTLNHYFLEIKNNYDLPENREIKWSYIWSLRKQRINTT